MCKPTHPKADAAMDAWTKRTGKRGKRRKCKGIDLLPINGSYERGGRVGVTGWKWDGEIDELRDNTLCFSWGKGGWRKPVWECTGR